MASGGVPADPLEAHELKAALAASMAGRDSKGKKLDITAEEADSLQKAFEKPEFRTLFHDYLQEISDPKNKKEYDDYLQSLEAKGQVPDSVNIVRPTAGFCVKVKTVPKKTKHTKAGQQHAEEARKVFVNVCSSDKVDLPAAKPVTQGGRTGQSWSLPHFVGPQHVEQDKKGNACETYDVCFHPSAIAMGEANPAFKDMLARTSLEAVVRAVHQVRQNKDYALDIDHYHVLVGRACIGEKPAALNVPKSAADNTSKKSTMQKATDLAAAVASSGGGGKGKGKGKVAGGGSNSGGGGGGGGDSNDAAAKQQRAAETSWTKKGFLNKKKKKTTTTTKPGGLNEAAKQQQSKKALIKEVSAKDADAKRKTETRNADGTLQPIYSLLHRGMLEMANYMTDLTHAPKSTRPKELVVTVELPAISSARTVDLDVSETHLKLRVPKIYALCVTLPFPVDDERGAAKFDKTRRALVVTLPVRPPTYTPEQLQAASTPTAAAAAVATTSDDDDDDDDTPPAREVAAEDGEKLSAEGDDNDSVDDTDYVLVDSPAAAKGGKGGAGTGTGSNPCLDADAERKLRADHESLSAEIARRAAEAVAAEAARVAALPRKVDKYVCRQTATSVTVLVPAERVDPASARVDFHPRGVQASFSVTPTASDRGDAAPTPLNFELELLLGGEVVPSESRFSVSSKNMVLILTKAAPGLWDAVELTGIAAAAAKQKDKKKTAAGSGGDGDDKEGGADSDGDGAAGPVEPFEAAAAYAGRRPGRVFRAGAKGLGYYRDTGPFVDMDAQFAGDKQAEADGSPASGGGGGGTGDAGGNGNGGGQGEAAVAAPAPDEPTTSGSGGGEDQSDINVFENNFVFELD